MNCLVLAFETLDDLPKDWKKCSTIDAYGQSQISDKDIGESPVELNIYKQFFEISNYRKPKNPYGLCFIRHPDPWGEPRNWMQAITALGECLSGELQCEFWFPHEIKAFDFLLNSLLGESAVRLIEAKETVAVGEWQNFRAIWSINAEGPQTDMLEKYRKTKMITLQKFYCDIGKYFWQEKSLNYILKEL